MFFSAAVDREALIQERLRDLSDSLCEGSLMPMLTGLVQLRRWTPSEKKRLNDLVAELNGANTDSSDSKKNSKRGTDQ